MAIVRGIRVNFIGVVAVIALTAVGLVNLASVDYYSGDSFHRAQLVWMLLGYVVAIIVFFVDIRVFYNLAYVGYGVLLALLIATRLFGLEVNNSTRWLVIGGMQLQPSEFMKMGLILALARLVHQTKGNEPYTLKTLAKPFVLTAPPAALVLIQPDLGTSLIILFVAVSVLLVEGVRLRTVLFIGGVALLVVPISWEYDLIHRYQKDRVTLWLNAENLDPSNPEEKRILDKNLQSEQALWAIGSGRMLGKGLRGGGKSRLRYLPEMHNDFVIATFAEEHGFAGCFALSALYFAVLIWALRVAKDAKERFGSLVAAGVAAMIFWQYFVNIGMVTGLLPVVGLTLPLLSYGGSSILTTFVGIGLLLNISVSKVKLA